MKHWAPTLFLNVAGIIVPAAHSKLYGRVNAQLQNGVQLSLLSTANASLIRKTGSNGSREEGARCRSTIMVACWACWSVILNVLGVAQLTGNKCNTHRQRCVLVSLSLSLSSGTYATLSICTVSSVATPSSVPPSYRVFSGSNSHLALFRLLSDLTGIACASLAWNLVH